VLASVVFCDGWSIWNAMPKSKFPKVMEIGLNIWTLYKERDSIEKLE
jgi:hypothetical protein